MGIDVPDLDDREFEEIFESARRQIPIYTEEWTDHNTHDTGIAILRLLSWVTETYTYQLNRVADDDREKYLKLLGVSRKPPTPATTSVAVTVPPGADGARLPAGEKLTVDDRSGVTKTFETDADAVLSGAEIERVVTNAGNDTVNNTTENETSNTHFYPFGKDPRAGDALYLGFDRDPFANTDRLELTFDFYDDDLPETATHGDYESTFEPSVEVTWEHCADYDNWADDDAWATVPVSDDETDAFYGGGRVALAEPSGWSVDPSDVERTELYNQPSGLVWLRCRVETAGYEIPPQFNSVRLNVLPVSHRATIEGELLQRADDSFVTTIESGQEFFFEHAPVLDATITVAGTEWTEVDDLDTSGPQDRHYLLDEQRGAVVFGNGIDGAKPPVGEHVRAEAYVHGGGTDGNVSETAEWEFEREEGQLGDEPLSEVAVRPLAPATGGTDKESIGDALDRFKRDLKVPYRGSTLDEYSYVAEHTPGLRVGRATATSDTRPSPTGEEIREITVVVVPYSTQLPAEPSEGFLDAVERHLQECRLLTDQVRVCEPDYVTVGVQLTVAPAPGYDSEAVTRAVEDEIQAYLHPISGYDGEGWPFGRQLYVSEVEDVVETLSSVRSVESVGITASGEESVDDYGNVIIGESSLLSVSNRDIDVSVASADGGRRGRR